MAVNWGLGAGNNALAHFQYGAQLGQQMADRREQREQRNALLGMQQQKLDMERQEQQREVQTADVRTRAAQGDPQAMAELAGLDFNAWRGLGADQRAMAKERSGILGNAALDVLSRPPEQRAAAWDAYVSQLAQQMPELAQYQGQYSEENARSIVAQAELIGKLHDLEQPRYQVIPEGGVMVNTRDPQAVQQYSGAGPQPGTVVGGFRYRGGNPNDRNSWEPVSGGGVGNGTGGFRP